MLLAALATAAAPSGCTNAVAQADMNRCAALAATRADAALNAAWVALSAHTGGSRSPYLAAQRQWLRFRDAECAAEAGTYEGGSMQPMVKAGCIEQLSAERARHLRALAEEASR